MEEEIRISAKNLGELALPDTCHRCFWIKLKVNNRLPFQIFPGIFSSIDSYTKNIINTWFDKHKKLPAWLKGIKGIKSYKPPPHYSKFFYIDEKYNINLWGSPDAIFIRKDGSHLIVDYKTAKYTEAQDELLPMYEIQLNSYALIGQNSGLAPISGLALIYMEPITDLHLTNFRGHHHKYGFTMGFSSHVHNVKLDIKRVKEMLKELRSIYNLKEPPKAKSDCKDCKFLESIVRTVS